MVPRELRDSKRDKVRSTDFEAYSVSASESSSEEPLEEEREEEVLFSDSDSDLVVGVSFLKLQIHKQQHVETD